MMASNAENFLKQTQEESINLRASIDHLIQDSYLETGFQSEPDLSDADWIERFVTHLVKRGAKSDTKVEVEDYARSIARSYSDDRTEFTDPEEAADTDISYWKE